MIHSLPATSCSSTKEALESPECMAKKLSFPQRTLRCLPQSAFASVKRSEAVEHCTFKRSTRIARGNLQRTDSVITTCDRHIVQSRGRRAPGVLPLLLPEHAENLPSITMWSPRQTTRACLHRQLYDRLTEFLPLSVQHATCRGSTPSST